METYQETYARYKKFALDRGVPSCDIWDFETWLRRKDAPPKSKYQATVDFIKEMEKLVKV